MTHGHTIAELISRVLIGDPWHGDSVASLLEGVNAAHAQRRPIGGAHSIWELVRHMTGWAREGAARLAGAPAGEPASGDWPLVTDRSASAWAGATRDLFDAHASLVAALERTTDDELLAPVLDRRDRAAGTGLTKLMTLHGVVHHTVYHAGQIAMLKRALEEGGRRE